MRQLTRLWRSVFDYSEIPSDAPSGLDDRRARWAALSMLFPFVPTFVVAVVLMRLDLGGEFAPLIGTAAIIIVFGGCLMAAFRFAHGKPAAHFRAIRLTAKAPALAAGYEFHDTFPAPSPGMSEAVFYRWRNQLVADRLTEVITGVAGTHRFTAGHLEGFEIPRTQRPTRSPYSENIVMIALPGLLPELKLRDRSASSPRDYGITLPSAPTGDPAVDARWDVQSHHPELARMFFTPEVREYLARVPLVPCTMVIRNGYLVSCRDPLGSFESISERLAIMTGLIDLIPAELWERPTTALEAGSGRVAEGSIKVTGWPMLRR